jgi:hypothetical protein
MLMGWDVMGDVMGDVIGNHAYWKTIKGYVVITSNQ